MQLFTGGLGLIAIIAAGVMVFLNRRGSGSGLVYGVAAVLAFAAGLRFVDAAPGGIIRSIVKVASFGWGVMPTIIAAVVIAIVAGALFGGKPDLSVVVLAFAIPTLWVMALNGPYGPQLADAATWVHGQWNTIAKEAKSRG